MRTNFKQHKKLVYYLDYCSKLKDKFKMLPIVLSATPQNWRLFTQRREDPAFKSFEKKIFNRDNYTCRFCRFSGKLGVEVVNRDQDYHNNHINNLLTSCLFCTQCFFLEAIGRGQFGGGVLIALPEITQAELNALCHVLFESMLSKNAYAKEARNIYRALKLRLKIVEDQLGEGFSNPALLGEGLVNANQKSINVLGEEVEKSLRLLPDFSKFINIIALQVAFGLDQLIK